MTKVSSRKQSAELAQRIAEICLDNKAQDVLILADALYEPLEEAPELAGSVLASSSCCQPNTTFRPREMILEVDREAAPRINTHRAARLPSAKRRELVVKATSCAMQKASPETKNPQTPRVVSLHWAVEAMPEKKPAGLRS